jgi:hypothetical protein
MKNGIVLVASLTAGLLVSTGHAQPPKPAEAPADKPAAAGGPPAVPKPAVENEMIKKSAGTWSCTGATKTPDGKELAYKSSWTIKPSLGGHWYTIVYKRPKAGPMSAFEGNGTVGYRAADKKYVFIAFDNFGGWLDLSSADGAVYTGEGTANGPKGPVKFTFAGGKDKKGEESDKLFDVTLDFGAFMANESCKK